MMSCLLLFIVSGVCSVISYIPNDVMCVTSIIIVKYEIVFITLLSVSTTQ